jgi:hypothetical protein
MGPQLARLVAESLQACRENVEYGDVFPEKDPVGAHFCMSTFLLGFKRLDKEERVSGVIESGSNLKEMNLDYFEIR